VRHKGGAPFNTFDGAPDDGLFPRTSAQVNNMAKYGDRLRDVCVANDPICAGGDVVEDHLNYFDLYTNQAAAWFREMAGVDEDSTSTSTSTTATSTTTTSTRSTTTTTTTAAASSTAETESTTTTSAEAEQSSTTSTTRTTTAAASESTTSPGDENSSESTEEEGGEETNDDEDSAASSVGMSVGALVSVFAMFMFM
jgi:uncharacterized membrane protein